MFDLLSGNLDGLSVLACPSALVITLIDRCSTGLVHNPNAAFLFQVSCMRSLGHSTNRLRDFC